MAMTAYWISFYGHESLLDLILWPRMVTGFHFMVMNAHWISFIGHELLLDLSYWL